jgi:hypothetical protein
MSKTFEAYCADNNIDAATLNDSYRKVVTAAWKAETTQVIDPAPEVPGGRAIEAARQREQLMAEIGQMVSAALNAKRINADTAERISLKAAAENWTKLQVENEILKAERPQVGVLPARETGTVADDVLEAAVCVAGKLKDVEKHYRPEVLEAANKAYRHGLGIEELVLTYARRSGFSGLNLKANTKGALQAAFAPDIRAGGSWGPSTGGGLSGVLSNVANKFLREGFMAVESVWRNITAIRSVNDFKQITTYSITGGLNFNKVAPGGEIKHGQLGAESYNNQVDTRGIMLGIDRRDLINDDLDALTGVGRRLGRGGALSLNLDFWTVFLNNSSFFTAGRNNVSTGAGSALGVAGLDAANAKFLTQTDPDGNPLGVMPSILLVPPALWSTGAQLMQSTGLNQTPASNAAAGDANIWAGKYRLFSSAYMQNTNLTGNSSAAWYLLADPSDMPVIETAFLNGNETPTVETADADFSMLGISMRAYMDYGIAFQEYRGGVRSAGS